MPSVNHAYTQKHCVSAAMLIHKYYACMHTGTHAYAYIGIHTRAYTHVNSETILCCVVGHKAWPTWCGTGWLLGVEGREAEEGVWPGGEGRGREKERERGQSGVRGR